MLSNQKTGAANLLQLSILKEQGLCSKKVGLGRLCKVFGLYGETMPHHEAQTLTSCFCAVSLLADLQEDGALWAQVAALCLEFRVSVNQ